MLSDREYVRMSLETNLFFLRIVKEHAIFAAASLPPRDLGIVNKLIALKNEVEELLADAIEMADRIVSYEVLASEELVTDYTLAAEMKTQFLTGIPINTDLTRRELELRAEKKNRKFEDVIGAVAALNKKAKLAAEKATAFKRALLKSVLECKAFSYSYPTMLEHVIEEGQYYILLLEKLEKRDGIDSIREIVEQEINWNHIMEEHSKFIRGYLDPEEEKLFNTANAFAKEFDELTKKTEELEEHPDQVKRVTRESMKDVAALRSFKVQGTEGILKCKIKSVIPPLLADHVTREANYYLRLLKAFEKMV